MVDEDDLKGNTCPQNRLDQAPNAWSRQPQFPSGLPVCAGNVRDPLAGGAVGDLDVRGGLGRCARVVLDG